MLPSPPSDWFQRMASNLALAVVVVTLPLLPARHVLLPLWPRSVDEIILATVDERSGARFFVDAERQQIAGDIVARDRPRSLVVVERIGLNPLAGFLLAVRASAEAPLEPLPGDMERRRVPGAALGDAILVLALADEQVVEIPGESVRRLYRPNRLDAPQRLALLWDRVLERLQGRVALPQGMN